MYNRKYGSQIVSSSGAIPTNCYSRRSNRITSVESHSSFQSRVKKVSLTIAVLLFTSPFWASYMVRTLVSF